MKPLTVPSTKPKKRTFLPNDYHLTDWNSAKVYYEALLAEEPRSVEELEVLLKKADELEAVIREDQAWRYINNTRFTNKSEYQEAFLFFIQEIQPQLTTYQEKLNRQIFENPFFAQLDDSRFFTYKRTLKRQLELFQEENVTLNTEIQRSGQTFTQVVGGMSIEHEGQDLPLQQAYKLLEETRDREARQELWEKVVARRTQDQDQLQNLFDKLLTLRTKVAQNAGFESFTDFSYARLLRFDYTREDVIKFHQSVERVITPIMQELMEERRQILGVDVLKPWDLGVNIFGDEPLKPFDGERELTAKAVSMLSALKPELGEMIALMDEVGYLDLGSRLDKAPGGYNYPLPESGIPFIFMNAVGSQKDMITMLHESGHAVHAFLTQPIELKALKHTPSEVAELAAMTMELLGMEQYKYLYDEESLLSRAKKEQLIRCIMVMPWIATVDAFQHWLYDNPNHTQAERNAKWKELYLRFQGQSVDYTGYEEELENMWLKQFHIFEVPFYYIEYALAQLGALAIWRNYQQDPEKGLADFLEALKLGYTQPIPEIYQTAGINFAFSEDYLTDIMGHCIEAYRAL
ncbi:MAG: M3 family oligoendopeptidase [Bacteroidota bacterium]